MFYFEVETIEKKQIIKNNNLKELKKEYDKIFNNYNWLSLTPIKKEK